MKVLELAKQLNVADLLALILDEKGFSDSEVSTILEISKQTLHNSKKRNHELLEALKMVKSPPAEYGDHNINKIINTFTESFGTTKSTKYDRLAAKRLYEKHGLAPICGAIKALANYQSDKYSPVTNNVSQFEEKLPSIAKFLNSKSNEQVIEL